MGPNKKYKRKYKKKYKKKFISTFFNNAGISLVNALMALGAVGAASAGIMKVTHMSMSSSSAAQGMLDEIFLMREITQGIDIPRHCDATFGGLVIEESSNEEGTGIEIKRAISSTPPQVKFQPDDTYGSLTITGLNLTLPDEAFGGTDSKYVLGTLNVSWEKKVSGQIRTKDQALMVPLEVTPSTSNSTINFCNLPQRWRTGQSIADMSEEIKKNLCQQLGLEWIPADSSCQSTRLTNLEQEVQSTSQITNWERAVREYDECEQHNLIEFQRDRHSFNIQNCGTNPRRYTASGWAARNN